MDLGSSLANKDVACENELPVAAAEETASAVEEKAEEAASAVEEKAEEAAE